MLDLAHEVSRRNEFLGSVEGPFPDMEEILLCTQNTAIPAAFHTFVFCSATWCKARVWDRNLQGWALSSDCHYRRLALRAL